MFLHDFKKALPPSLLQVIWHPALVLPVTSFWTRFLYIFVCFCCFSCSLRLFILIYCLIGRHCLRIYMSWCGTMCIVYAILYTNSCAPIKAVHDQSSRAAEHLGFAPKRHKQKTTQTQCHLCEKTVWTMKLSYAFGGPKTASILVLWDALVCRMARFATESAEIHHRWELWALKDFKGKDWITNKDT